MSEIDISKLKPTNDYIFKRIFGRKGSEKITEGLIRNFVGLKDIEIEEVKEDKILAKDIYSDKLAILDICAKTKNNEIINIEMQCGNYNFIKDRIAVYLCKTFGREAVKAGENYGETRKVIAVLICKDKMDVLSDIPKWKTNWHIREDEYTTKVLTEKVEIVIIELEKLTEKLEYKEEKVSKEEKAWHKFFLNPKMLGVKEMSENVDVKIAKEKYDEVLDDETEAQLAFSRQMYRFDMSCSRKEGYDNGMQEGQKIGEKKGEKKGAKQAKIEIAKNMLEEGMEIEIIAKITGLSKKDIEKIKKG